MRYINILLFLVFVSGYILGQEVCDNGIDDDNDGLIDLNDGDCDCPALIPSSLIPNPSFEDRTCCPQNESMLNCAVSWIQASVATSDYFNTCGLTFHQFLGYRAPFPLPDGDGFVGFRDGKPGSTNFKEYIGACLNDVMEVGTNYRLDFFLGFPVNPNNFDDIDITVYATTSCNNLPFGQGNANFGCPTNGPNWTQIATQNISGVNEWVNVVFEFEADKEYTAIVIGPGCDIHPDVNRNPYFFADRLTLAKSAEFLIPFAEIQGNLCEENLTLIAEDMPGNTFQWYKDGIAIIGETNPGIDLAVISDNEGEYQVLITDAEGCFLSEVFDFTIPFEEFTANESICEGSSYEIGGDLLTEEDQYIYELTSVLGCDSIVTLNLEVLSNSSSSMTQQICFGDDFDFYGALLGESGTYLDTIRSKNGCDSIVTLDLNVVEYPNGIELDESDFDIDLGDLLTITPTFIDPALDSFKWVNSTLSTISITKDLIDYLPINDEELTFVALDREGCGAEVSLSIRVRRDIGIYYPNIFSPNGDDINDVFRFHSNQAIVSLVEFVVYDRWGSLVYKEGPVVDLETMVGWQGQFDSRDATRGVYAFVARFLALDGEIELVTGDITLIR